MSSSTSYTTREPFAIYTCNCMWFQFQTQCLLWPQHNGSLGQIGGEMHKNTRHWLRTNGRFYGLEWRNKYRLIYNCPGCQSKVRHWIWWNNLSLGSCFAEVGHRKRRSIGLFWCLVRQRVLGQLLESWSLGQVPIWIHRDLWLRGFDKLFQVLQFPWKEEIWIFAPRIILNFFCVKIDIPWQIDLRSPRIEVAKCQTHSW